MKAFSRAIAKKLVSILCLAAIILQQIDALDAQSRASAGASDHLIVPGERIGPIFIGMTETQLYQRLGDPSETVRGNDGTWIEYDYNNLGLSIYADPATHKVYTIGTQGDNSPYSTREGIRVGSSELQVQILPWKLLWKRVAHGRWKFQYPGIQIETQNGNVIFIAVQSHN